MGHRPVSSWTEVTNEMLFAWIGKHKGAVGSALLSTWMRDRQAGIAFACPCLPHSYFGGDNCRKLNMSGVIY